jgi:aspartyl-tRNA(Asn)/glutamyl-tRNA(Gln) amidotransferase subunit A
VGDLTDLTLFEAADKVARREVSPVELVEAHLQRIAALDPQLNCFITLTAEAARASAERAEAELKRGGYRGLLHGLPLALKDLYATQGVRTTAGALCFTDNVPAADAALVQKLEAGGAVLLGKLNMHEIALGVTNQNPHFGDCCNPWDTSHITGGSSGGCGAALAAGLCLGALGSDTGGSIRIPASLCGVVGLKPTYGRASLRGVIPLSWNLDHAGPMARRVQDVAILLQAIAGHDPEDPVAVDAPVDDYLSELGAGVRGWRVALAMGEFFEQCDEVVLQAVQEAGRVFAGLGATVTETLFEQAREAAQANGLMTICDAAAFHRERLQNAPEKFGVDVLERLQGGAAVTASDYSLARRTQTRLRHAFTHFFDNYDLLLLPATPMTAPPRVEQASGVGRARQLTRFTAPFNLTGLPALVLPCGCDAAGLPIGLQLVAAPWAEKRLLQASYAYEQATDWYLRRPAL